MFQSLKSAVGFGSEKSASTPEQEQSAASGADLQGRGSVASAPEQENEFVTEARIPIDTEAFPPGRTAIQWLMGTDLDKNNIGLQRFEKAVGKGVVVGLGGRQACDGTDDPLHLKVTAGDADSVREVEKLVRQCYTKAYEVYRGGVQAAGVECFNEPETLEHMLYNMHVLCYAQPKLPINGIEEMYVAHFGHKFQKSLWPIEEGEQLLLGIQKFPHLFKQFRLEDEDGKFTGHFCLSASLPVFTTLAGLCAANQKKLDDLKVAMAATKRKRDHRDDDSTSSRMSKARKLGDDSEFPRPADHIVRSVVQGLHRVIVLATGGVGKSVPIALLPAEFERYWKIPIDPVTLGKPTITEFLFCFPKVFAIKQVKLLTGFVVEALPEPNFDLKHEIDPDFSVDRQLPLQFADDFAGLIAASTVDRLSKHGHGNKQMQMPSYEKLVDLANVIARAAPEVSTKEIRRLVEGAYCPKNRHADLKAGQFHNDPGSGSAEAPDSDDEQQRRSSMMSNPDAQVMPQMQNMHQQQMVNQQQIQSRLGRADSQVLGGSSSLDVTNQMAAMGKMGGKQHGKGGKQQYGGVQQTMSTVYDDDDLDGAFEFSPTSGGDG